MACIPGDLPWQIATTTQRVHVLRFRRLAEGPLRARWLRGGAFVLERSSRRRAADSGAAIGSPALCAADLQVRADFPGIAGAIARDGDCDRAASGDHRVR